MALVGRSTVNGGLVTGPGAVSTFGEGVPVALVGDAVAPHDPFIGEHLAATLVQGSVSVIVEGRPVVYVGCLASCGHAVESGAVSIFVGG